MTRDIDLVIGQVWERLPAVIVRQHQVSNPLDDDHIWWFSLPQVPRNVQVEPTTVNCQFLLETDEQSSATALRASSVAEAVRLIVEYLTRASTQPGPVFLDAGCEETWAHDLIAEFSLIPGPPTTADDRASLDCALAAIQLRLDQAQVQEPIRFDADQLLRCDEWWYVPFGWIGCAGFIVDRRDGYVNWLGSSLMLSDCFWGHHHGIFCGPVDFTFTSDLETSYATALDLVKQFRRYTPNDGLLELDDYWYSEPASKRALDLQFPQFPTHFVWGAIPALRRATAAGLISFHAAASKLA